MGDNLKEFLHKSTIGLEIEDLGEEENVDEMRQSRVLENYGSREVLDAHVDQDKQLSSNKF